jgi:hypothetical protein
LTKKKHSISGEGYGSSVELYDATLEENQQPVTMAKVRFYTNEKLLSFVDFASFLVTFNPHIVNCLG